jgi:Lrp/AsnC family leucine-responsive transcriptional regulator
MNDLDVYDKHILAILQEEGKISNQDLAERVGLSASPCLRRVKALEDRGIIKSYHALLDPKKVDLGLTALIQISMDKHTTERFGSFEKEIVTIPEILECLLITGQSADYQLKVIVKDLEEYQKLLLQKITKIPGVTGVHSSFVLNKVIEKTAIPVY